MNKQHEDFLPKYLIKLQFVAFEKTIVNFQKTLDFF